MKIVILNSGTTKIFNNYISALEVELKKNCEIKVYDLQQMHIKYCIACYNCWWKTPGLCFIKDDAEEIFKSVINADFVIFASPLIGGFTSALLKKITERFIVLIHPFVEIRKCECHHKKRYLKHPLFGLIMQKETDTDKADIEITTQIYKRIALIFHSTLKYVKLIDDTAIEEIAYETFNL